MSIEGTVGNTTKNQPYLLSSPLFFPELNPRNAWVKESVWVWLLYKTSISLSRQTLEIAEFNSGSGMVGKPIRLPRSLSLPLSATASDPSTISRGERWEETNSERDTRGVSNIVATQREL